MKKESHFFREFTWLSSLTITLLLVLIIHGSGDVDVAIHDTFFVVDFKSVAVGVWSIIFLVVTIVRFFADKGGLASGKKFIVLFALLFVFFLFVMGYQIYVFADGHRGLHFTRRWRKYLCMIPKYLTHGCGRFCFIWESSFFPMQ